MPEVGVPAEPAGTDVREREAVPVAAPATAAVQLSQVVKRFDDVTAVDGVDLRIADGEFFSLLGASGCGKTTTLRMIAGLEYPTQGSITIYGEEMGLKPPNKRPVNTVFQSYALFPHMSVEQNVAFGLQMRGLGKAEIRDQVAQVIELVRLAGMERRRPRQLSGGQQQRVALARALVNRPKVLLLDEPLGALDLKLRQAMQLELKVLQERVGITFIYVTHDQEEALTMSDRIGVMDAGRLVQVGTPEEIYEHPRTRMVADFIGQTNLLPAVVSRRGEVHLIDGQRVYADAKAEPGTEVTLTLRPEKVWLAPADHEEPCRATNALIGSVVRRVYRGSSLTYEVELGEVKLRVRHENSPGFPAFAAGDEVCVEFAPESARALED